MNRTLKSLLVIGLRILMLALGILALLALVIFLLLALGIPFVGWLYPQITMQSSDWAAWVTAASTIVLGAIAIFHEPILGLIYAPKLELLVEDRERNLVKAEGKYWFRLGIKNVGARPAKDVQVMMEAICKKRGNGYSAVPDILFPVNATWAYGHAKNTNGRIYPEIPAGSERYCDLFQVHGPPCDGQLKLSMNPRVYDTDHLEAGDYRFELLIETSNAENFRRKLYVHFEGKWYEQPQDMWSAGLIVSEHR
jgi:hypothetical protein